MSSKKKVSKESKISRFLKAPIRVLIKARELYIRSMTECSDRINYGTVLGCPTGQVNTLPKSFSVNSTRSSKENDDLRELVRAASTRSLRNKVELEFQRQQAKQSPMRDNHNIPRSHSVGIGRIDEDQPCEFGEVIEVKADVFPRSRSHAVSKRTPFY